MFTPPRAKEAPQPSISSKVLVPIETAERLYLGMTRLQVEQLLGPPCMTSADIAQMTGKPLPENNRFGYFYDVPDNGQCVIGFLDNRVCYAVITNGSSQTVWKIDNGL